MLNTIFLLLLAILAALIAYGVVAVVRQLAAGRDSQHSREAQFFAEQSLELTRQRAGRGTPPAGAALQSPAVVALRGDA